MRRNRTLIISFVFVAVFILVFGSYLQTTKVSKGSLHNGIEDSLDNEVDCKQTIETPEDFEIQLVFASWALWYYDFEGLLKDNDLVIVGEVISEQDPYSYTINTLHEVLVLDVIKDTSGKIKADDTITVSQFGGFRTTKESERPVLVEVNDSPFMREGEVSLLFLNARNYDGIFGGLSPQSRYIVKNNKVCWLGAVYDRGIISSENLEIEGAELEEVVSLLRQLSEGK